MEIFWDCVRYLFIGYLGFMTIVIVVASTTILAEKINIKTFTDIGGILLTLGSMTCFGGLLCFIYEKFWLQ